MSPPFEKTPLHLAIENDKKGDIRRIVTFVAHRRGVFGAEADDVLQKAYELALAREWAGDCWDPTKKAVTLYMAEIAVDAVKILRRAQRRRPAEPIQKDQDFASAAPNAAEVMEELQERSRLVQRVRALCVEETNGGLCTRVMDAVAGGTTAHKDIATELRCELEDVRNAMKRLERRARKVAMSEAGG